MEITVQENGVPAVGQERIAIQFVSSEVMKNFDVAWAHPIVPEVRLVIGGVIGWLASIVMRTDAQQGIFLNIIVGIVGAFIGGLIFSGGSINNAGLNLYSFLVSLLGAVVLLAIVNLFRRGSVR